MRAAADLVFDDSNFLPVVGVQDVVEKGRFAAAKIPSEHSDWHSFIRFIRLLGHRREQILRSAEQKSG